MLVFATSRCSRRRTYEVENASGGGLVLSTLGEEEQTLAGLAGPGDDRVGDSGLLVATEDGQLLGLDSIVAEVEEALGETETPETNKKEYMLVSVSHL